jgi:hypothetical protein
METLEATVQAAPNIKLDIKTAARAMGVTIREFDRIAKKLGMGRNPDAVEQRVRMLQHQQLQQHAQTLELLREIRVEQTSQQSNVAQEQSFSDIQLTELEAISLQLAEQGKKIDLEYSQTLQLRKQVNAFMQSQPNSYNTSIKDSLVHLLCNLQRLLGRQPKTQPLLGQLS